MDRIPSSPTPPSGFDSFNLAERIFVIESDALDAVETHLYGYCLIDGGIVEDAALLDKKPISPEGCYVYVRRANDVIEIRQDFIGCWGLYLYEDEDYWALSNSFHALLDAVGPSHPLTMNERYADHTLVAGLSALAYEETMVEEVRLIDRSAIVRIDIPNGTRSEELVDFHENTLAVDEPEGMATLDRWFAKWTAIARSVVASTSNVFCDLSGGFDSRLVASLFLGSDVGFSKVCVVSNEDDLSCHGEDLEIASEIARHYGFALNDWSRTVHRAANPSLDEVIELSMQLKLGFHTQMYYKPWVLNRYRYSFTGNGGGCIRDLSASLRTWTDERTVTEGYARAAEKFGLRVVESTRAVLSRTFTGIHRKYAAFGRPVTSEEEGMRLYMETRNRNHFGKSMVESWCSGLYAFAPLIDPDLRRLRTSCVACADANLLIAVMFDRYAPDLLDFPFEGGRSIAPDTVAFARELNARYPLAGQTGRTETPSGVAASVRAEREVPVADAVNEPPTLDDAKCLTGGALYAPAVRATIEELYSPRIYRLVVEGVGSSGASALTRAYEALAIARVAEACQRSDRGSLEQEAGRHFGVADFVLRAAAAGAVERVAAPAWRSPYLLHYLTARIDLECMGEGCQLELVEASDQLVRVSHLKQLNTGGDGYRLHADSGALRLRVRCMGAGILHLALGTEDVKGSDGRRVPFWIDCTQCMVNGRDVLAEGDELDVTDMHHASLAHPLKRELPAADGSEFIIELAWRPHDETLCALTDEEKTSADPGLKTVQRELATARTENKALRGELKATQQELKAALRRTPAGLARRVAGALRHPSRIVRKLRALLGRRSASTPSTRS